MGASERAVALSEGAQRAALVLARGGSKREAAAAGGVVVATLRKWMREDAFVALRDELASDPARQAAMEVMLDARDPWLKLSAARILGRRAEPETEPEPGAAVTLEVDRERGRFRAEGEEEWRPLSDAASFADAASVTLVVRRARL